jgi:hypothetical protein
MRKNTQNYLKELLEEMENLILMGMMTEMIINKPNRTLNSLDKEEPKIEEILYLMMVICLLVLLLMLKIIYKIGY